VGEFRNLSDIATGSAQTLYVADAGNDRIQIIHPGGQIEVESFEDVSLVAVAPDALYAAAYDSITRLSSPPELSYSWGPDGTLGTSFDYLASIATDAAGDVYALDGYVGKVYRFSDDGSGNIERKWEVGGIGVDPGEYRNASALTVAGARVFIADSDNYRVQVLNALDGSFLFGWTTTDQYGDKTDPDDVGVHPSGMVYVTSWGVIYGYTLKS
jgi:hypothetical protein